MRVATRTYLGSAVNGTATTGKVEAPSTNPLDGYIQTVRSDADFNSPFSGRPDSLTGYYKYDSQSSDGGLVEVILHGNFDVTSPDQGGSATQVIAVATFNTPNADVNSWTRFSVPFTYYNTNTPAYILAIVTSSAVPGGGTSGSTLWVDNLEAVYNPPCSPTTATLTETTCDSYTSPSGKYTWSATGIYTDTLTNASGCDSVVTIDLTVQQVDVAVTQSGHVLTASAVGAAYQWLDCKNGNAPIAGATSKTFTATAPGEYAVEVTENGCIDVSTCYTITVVGIEENLFGREVRLFPNPGRDVLNLQFDNQLQSAKIKITDLQGREVFNQNFERAKSIKLDLSNLVGGVYFVRVNTGEKVGLVKWVKE
jgi:hypothetical protein